MPKINPDILTWARETAGLTMEEGSRRLGIKAAQGVPPVERLANLEAGLVDPTRPMLVKMAKQYRRPLLTFYLSQRPRPGNRGQDYRTLPDTVETIDVALVDAVIRDIHARQSLIRNVLVDENEAEALAFVGSMAVAEGVPAMVTKLRSVLAFRQDVFRAKHSINSAFVYLRELAEKAGVFVLLVDNLGSWHSNFSVDAFRGFAIADDIAPFVAINANDSKGAWCFTLLHELAHIMLGDTGVSGGRFDNQVEKYCNDVASEFLLPAIELRNLSITQTTALDEAKALIKDFARMRNVSGTMVAYKLYRAGIFDFAHFDAIRMAFRQDFLDYQARVREKNRQKEGGPTYQILRTHRVGNALIRLVDRMIHSGAITTTKAGKVLGVSAKNVQGLLEAARPAHA